jgi:hypothetical protein
LILESNASPIRVETANVSRSGCYIEMLFTLGLGIEVHMTLQVGDSSLLAIDKVVTRDLGWAVQQCLCGPGPASPSDFFDILGNFEVGTVF